MLDRFIVFFRFFVTVIFGVSLSSCSVIKKITTGGGVDTQQFISQKSECVVALSKPERTFVLQNGDDIESIWTAKEKAFRLRIVASSGLNRYANLSHALTIGIYQLSKLDVIVKELVTQSGLKRLLLLKKLDATVLQYDLQVLQPRSSVRLDVSRVDGAKYLVFVAGYQSLVSEQVTRVIQWPLVRYTRSKFNPMNWFTANPKPFPADLDILVRLDDDRVSDFVVQVKNECAS